MELSLVQPEMLPWMIAISEDWHANRMTNVDFLSSYSNFSMVHCIRSEYHYKLSEISAAVQEMIEEEQEPSAKAARLVPKQPDVAPPMPKFIAPSATPSRSPETGRGSASSAVAPSSSRVATSLPRPPPVPQSDLSDDILQPEEWAIVREHSLDDQAVIALKRLGDVSIEHMQRVLGKLTRKGDIQNKSRFVSVACRNAQQKLSGAADA